MLVCGMASAQVTFDFTGTECYGMKLLSGSTQEYNPSPYECIEGSVTMTINGNSRWWKASSGNELRFYKESSFDISVPAGNVITKVVLTAKAPANFTTAIGVYDNGTWTGSSDKVTFNCIVKSSNTPITKIEVTYQESTAPVKKDPGLKFSEANVIATLGEPFTAPTLTKETTADVVFSSDNPDVAAVDAQTGAVTLVAEGTVKITAVAAENDEFAAGSASYEIKVTVPVRDEVNEPYTESFELGIGSFTLDDVSLGEGLSYVWKHDGTYKYMKASAYVNKKNIASESWLVSPWITLSSAEVVRTLSFEQCVNKYFADVTNEATLWIKEEGGDWKQFVITYPEVPEGKSFSEFEKQNVSLAGYEGKKIKIGFKYVSTDNAAGTWEIRNFSVNSGSSDISGVEADRADAMVIYNLSGQRLEKMQKGINIVNGKKIIKK